MRFFILAAFLFLSNSAWAGYAAVTPASDCILPGNVGDAAQIKVQYLEKSYARCINYSRKAIRDLSKTEENKDTPTGEILPDNVIPEHDSLYKQPLQYHRITPRQSQEGE